MGRGGWGSGGAVVGSSPTAPQKPARGRQGSL